MTVTQSDKAKQFRALHEAPEAFVVANVWDGGSARMMAGLGFAALATSSGASAGVLGRRDGRVTRDEALAQARVICDATDLPVSADLEKGFGDAPEIAAETIRLAAEADHANPPELGTVERAMKRVKHGRHVLIPAGPNTHGHFSHFYAELWKPYLIEFMQTLGAPLQAAAE